MRFKTSSEVIAMDLRVQRESEGRSGFVTHYSVESAKAAVSALDKYLPEANVQAQGEAQPEESPLTFKASGYVTLEREMTRRFGFDVGNATQAAQPNFTSSGSDPDQSNTSLLSNINLELSKDNTRLVSIFEIGEMYFGDTTSGGGQGGRANNIFEIRNFYLAHDLSENLAVSGGLMTVVSDPRSFIYNDHTASIQATFKTDLTEGALWYGDAAQNLVGATKNRDQYVGLLGSFKFFSNIKATLYGLFRNKAGDTFAVDDGTGTGTYTTLTGDSMYGWLGGTFGYSALEPFGLEFTAIGNIGRTKLGQHEDDLNAYLLDAKLTYAWAAPQTNFTLEALMTSGASGVNDSTSGKPIVGRRRNFVSPVAATYLMTVATSDGVDDAVGAPKQSIIGNLNLEEGLRILIFTTSVNITKRATLFGRAGHLMTAAASSTGSLHLGDEFDLGGVYQLSPSTTFQADYGRFFPGKFYSNRDFADLLSAKLKFQF